MTAAQSGRLSSSQLPATLRRNATHARQRSSGHEGLHDCGGVPLWRQPDWGDCCMRFASLTATVNRVFGWADGVQRRHGVLGFPYAVVKKYGDDDGGREAALITYYGFLSIFPLLLLGVAILSRVLTANPELQQRLISEIVPPVLRSTVEQAVSSLPTSTVPFVAGLIGLLFAGTGVVFSAYQTLNNVAAVPRRVRAGFFPRYIRV